MQNLEGDIIIAPIKVKLIKADLNEFIKKNFKDERNEMSCCVVYDVSKNRYEIKREYGGEFVENGNLPEKNEESISLINEFAKKHNLYIDYFVKLEMIQKMNHK
jgi:hypothetical protein